MWHDATMSPHPRFELLQDRCPALPYWCSTGLYQSFCTQERDELQRMGVCSVAIDQPPSRQIPTKAGQHAVVPPCKIDVTTLHPPSEMNDAADVLPDGERYEAVLGHRVREVV
jgi:hypothetical protein